MSLTVVKIDKRYEGPGSARAVNGGSKANGLIRKAMLYLLPLIFARFAILWPDLIISGSKVDFPRELSTF